jgi:hypothetical protein
MGISTIKLSSATGRSSQALLSLAFGVAATGPPPDGVADRAAAPVGEACQ